MNITQCRMGRAALGWNAKQLAHAAGLGSATIARFELGQNVAADSVAAMERAMTDHKVQFLRQGARLIVSVPESI